MSRQARYPAEVRERAVRMGFEHAGDYDSQWSAVVSIVGKIVTHTGQTLLRVTGAVS